MNTIIVKCGNRIKSFVRFSSYKSVKRPDLFGNAKNPSTPKTSASLAKQIRARILASGPITVADYMKEVLLNPAGGYYMNRDVFGSSGDFITSPEINQIFGELVAVWCLMEWQKIGAPSPFQIIEFGPGRGTLARDILRVLSQFKLGGQFSLHLVEVSPFLSKVQAQRLCFQHTDVESSAGEKYYQKGETLSGSKVFWYHSLDDVPRGFSIVLAHEFFDALPIHKLQRDGNVWKEILVDFDKQEDKFRLVMSKAETPVSKIYRPSETETRECLEYSIETMGIVEKLTERFESDGGFGLIMDYGHFGEKTDTFRAFKKHKLHDPLLDPGTADLTADVDFKQIKFHAEKDKKIITFGPVEQGTFIKRMEGDTRLKVLLDNALPENRDRIRSGYKMLTDPDQMGKRFKFFAMFSAVLKDHLDRYPVNGFVEKQSTTSENSQ